MIPIYGTDTKLFFMIQLNEFRKFHPEEMDSHIHYGNQKWYHVKRHNQQIDMTSARKSILLSMPLAVYNKNSHQNSRANYVLVLLMVILYHLSKESSINQLIFIHST